MIQDTTDNFIRNLDSEFISCTIVNVDSKGKAEVYYEKFKKALNPISTVVIYEYNNRYYYPLAMEFRLIDNNILYLTEELKINSIEEIFRILMSSMNKEEKWSNDFVLSVVHLKAEPKFSFKLSADFVIGQVTQEHVYE